MCGGELFEVGIVPAGLAVDDGGPRDPAAVGFVPALIRPNQ